MENIMKKIMFIINNYDFFISHRLPIAIEAKKKGYEILIACPNVPDINRYGFSFIKIEMNRGGTRVLQEIKSLINIFKIIKKNRPSIVHLVTIKPVLYGGIVLRFVKTKGVVFAVSGLGTIFTGKNKKTSVLRKYIKKIYKFILGNNNYYIIFQNKDDKEIIKRIKHINDAKIVMTNGSGVDLKKYNYIPELYNKKVVAMASRLLVEKGVKEYIKAAEIVHDIDPTIEFLLIGDIDCGNPSSLTEKEFEELKLLKYIKILGYRDDLHNIFQKVNIIVLPSYREGFPKVLLEAAACGRAIITTDVPGCREAIINNKTGLLVEKENAKQIGQSIIYLFENNEVRINMGREARKLAEKEFSIDLVVKKHLHIYDKIMSN